MKAKATALVLFLSLLLAIFALPAYAEDVAADNDSTPAARSANPKATCAASKGMLISSTFDATQYDLATQGIQQLTGDGSRIVQFSYDNGYMALLDDGTLWQWGGGFGAKIESFYDESMLLSLDYPRAPNKIMDGVKSFSQSANFVAVIMDDDSLWCWGRNEYGQVGAGNDSGLGTEVTTPVEVLQGVACVETNDISVAAIKLDGSLWMWGASNGRFQTPLDWDGKPVWIMDGAKSVSMGWGHTGVVKTDGSLWTWGHNEYGQTGHVGSVTPVKLMDEVESIDFENDSSVAKKTDGTLWVWGEWAGGSEITSPRLAMSDIESYSLGYDCVYGLDRNGDLYSFGGDPYGYGLLGNGDVGGQAYSAVKILDNVKMVSISASLYEGNACALTRDGTLWVWGIIGYDANRLNEDGVTFREYGEVTYPVPTQLATDVFEIHEGNAAVKDDGTVWLWGGNYDLEPEHVLLGNTGSTYIGEPSNSLTRATVDLSSSSFDYDGKAKEPAVQVALGGKTLVEGTDYTVSYKDNVGPGTASVTVTGIGEYTGSKTVRFSILDPDAATAVGTINLPFEGATVKARWGWKMLAERADTGEVDRDLQKVCLALAAAPEYDGGAEARVRAVMGSGGLGLEHVKLYPNDVDKPAVAFGYKKVRLGGKERNIIVCAVRGSKDPADIWTDIKATMASGFLPSARNTKAQMLEWLSKEVGLSADELASQDNVFLITGHSLGGATANCLAVLLDEYADRSEVFCYTFEAPATTTDKVGRRNIHNLVCPEDAVPTLVTSNYSRRFGSDEWWLPDVLANDHAYIRELCRLKGAAYSDFEARVTQYRNSFFGAFSFPEAVAIHELMCQSQWAVINNWHSVEASMAYLNTREAGTYVDGKSFYTGDSSNWTRVERFGIRCPVDVEVYDLEDALVARTVNNVVDPAYDSEIALVSDGEEKDFVLVGSGKYTVRLVGNGEGTMSCAASNASSEAAGETDEKLFANVSLSDGKRMAVISDEGDAVSETRLLVMGDDGNAVAEVEENGSEQPIGGQTVDGPSDSEPSNGDPAIDDPATDDPSGNDPAKGEAGEKGDPDKGSDTKESQPSQSDGATTDSGKGSPTADSNDKTASTQSAAVRSTKGKEAPSTGDGIPLGLPLALAVLSGIAIALARWSAKRVS